MIIRINGQHLAASCLPSVVTVNMPKAESRFMTWLKDNGSGTGMVLMESGFIALLEAYLGISRYLAYGVIMFAGTAWMFGHRPAAIERLIGGTFGYLIILHAMDYVNWLQKVGAGSFAH